jgi:hypothetical protein
MRSITKIYALLLIGIVLFITGCKDKAPTPTAMLTLHLHTNIDTNEVAPGTAYPNWEHKNISLSRAQYYISGIKLIKSDNSTVSVSGTTLVTMGIEQYMVGNVPVGTYKSISFNVGVQSADNHTELSSHTGTDALAAQNPSMHYSTTADGYIFLAVEGLVDSNASGTPNKAFSYHIGTDALLQTVTLGDHSAAPYNAPFIATANGSVTVHMVADYDKLFNTIHQDVNSQTNTLDGAWIAGTLAGNIPAMFEYEE